VTMIAWNEHLSVNITEIDNQHKKLLGMLNHLYEAMMARKAGTALTGIVEEMKEYAASHFALEEKHMRVHAYPELVRHKAEHDMFVDKARQVEEDIASGKCAMSVDVIAFLSHWLIEHIKVTDKAYAPYLIERGVK